MLLCLRSLVGLGGTWMDFKNCGGQTEGGHKTESTIRRNLQYDFTLFFLLLFFGLYQKWMSLLLQTCSWPFRRVCTRHQTWIVIWTGWNPRNTKRMKNKKQLLSSRAMMWWKKLLNLTGGKTWMLAITRSSPPDLRMSLSSVAVLLATRSKPKWTGDDASSLELIAALSLINAPLARSWDSLTSGIASVGVRVNYLNVYFIFPFFPRTVRLCWSSCSGFSLAPKALQCCYAETL